jgi:two-component system sensor histidine kinase/response regulator
MGKQMPSGQEPHPSASQLSHVETPLARVLIIDDDAVIRKVVSAQLSRLGVASEAVSGGREGLSRLAQGFELILLDCNMPDWDGYRTATELRMAGFRGTIIGLTADDRPGIRESCIEAGMNEFRLKPLQISDLQKALEKHLHLTGPSPDLGDESAPPRAPAHPLDRVRALAEASGKPALVERLVTSFVNATEESLARLRQAVESDDLTEALAVTHRLRGSAGSFGAVQLWEQATQAEDQLRQFGAQASSDSVQALLRTWAALKEQLS